MSAIRMLVAIGLCAAGFVGASPVASADWPVPCEPGPGSAVLCFADCVGVGMHITLAEKPAFEGSTGWVIGDQDATFAYLIFEGERAVDGGTHFAYMMTGIMINTVTCEQGTDACVYDPVQLAQDTEEAADDYDQTGATEGMNMQLVEALWAPLSELFPYCVSLLVQPDG